MDELIKMVSQKVGVSEDQARTAVNTVLGFLKDKLPAPIAEQVNGVLSGKTDGGAASSIGDAVSGMFGGGN